MNANGTLQPLVGNDPRENQVFNPVKQNEDFDAEETYRRFYI